MKKLLSIITAMVMIFCLMPPPITAEAALSITYREYAADGSYTEKTLQESEYLKCTGLNVLEDNTYFYSTSYTPSEKLTIKGNVNLILPVGSVFEVKQYIAIEQDATLNIYGAGTLITGQFNIFNNDCNVNLHGANFISLHDINVSSLTVNAGKVSAMVNGIFCTNLAVNGGTVEAESSSSPAIYVNGTFTVGKNGSVSGYSSNDAAFSKVPTVNNSDDIIVSYGDSKSSYSPSTTKPIDDDLISRHYVSIEKGKKSVDYIKREYADDTGVTDTPTSAPAVRSISSFSQPSALSGWYYVDGNVDLNYRPVISQNACIILTDGSTLNANCGIELPEGCTLEIYGQENGTGTIKSSLTDIAGDAFIGGDLGKKCGTLKLFGGNIKIDYNSNYHNDLIGNGAGIAIGDGAVYVYGGSIDAKAVQAIITTKLNIYGGSVTAFSYKDKAMYSVPAFGTGYIPTVKYGGSAESAKNATSPTDSSVYTSNKYVSIEKANITADYEYCKYDWDGSKLTSSTETANCTTLDDSYFPTALSDGWYAVKGDVTVSDRITINGDVHLILTDGFTLNAKRGINLPENSTLSIYGQSGGTGKLNAESGNKTAIGGEDEESCGTLNVYGGQVSAESSGTAIGGGKSAIKTAGNGGTVNVYSGQVSAESQGTAIGGGGSTDGTGGNGGTVNVYGGTVNAISDSETAIGGGFSTSGTGGTGSDLTVYGGKVSAKSSSFTAIGGGRTTSGTTGNPGTTHICGGSLIAYVIMDNNLPAFDHAPTYDAGYVPKVTFGDSPTNSATKISPDPTVYTGNRYVSIEQGTLSSGNYKYCSRSWNGSSVVSSIETQHCTTLNNEYFPKTLNSGWYAVEGNVTVLNQIEISGNVNLILTDGCALNVADSIHLTSGNTLNIYGQSKETGKLHIIPKSYTAIGAYDKDCGNLNIHGGIITAERSANGAAVGGSKAVIKLFGGDLNAISGNSEVIGGEGSEIYVYGGKIYADSFANTPSMSIPAIGVGASGKIVICGGSVTAYAFVNGAYAFDYAPTFDAGYIPKVSYGESESSTVTKVNPDNSVYTSNKYVSIEKADLTADYQYCSRSWNGSSVVTSIESHDCITLDNTYFPTTLTDGWYAVSGNVTISDRITVSGKVHLILLDNCNLNAKKGIYLPKDATLNIYGQSGGTGKLAASIYNYVIAAIGGGIDCESCGTLNIFGGEISAFSEYGAGIGSSRDNDENAENSGGIITIYGGKVTVDGHDSGIGGAPNDITLTGSSGSVLTIYGGDVTASCKGRPAIGGPAGGDGGSLAFYGGTLTAYSEYSICIGSEINRNNAVPSKGADTVVTIGKGVRIYTSPNADGSGKTLLTGYTDLGAELAKYKYAQFIINPCDHSGNINPTCEGANCSVCGTYIAPTGHKNGDPVTENRTFASCTEGGSYDEVVYCSVCGKEISRETKAIEPSEHTAGKPVIENEAADGTYDEVVYCAVCNAEMSRERKVKAEHKHIEGMADVITMPTFTSAGSRVFRCTLCGEILRSEAIPPITMDFPTNTVSSDNASQVIYTEFPELKFNVEIKDGIAVISWDKVETADRYVIYAIKDGKISEIAKIKKTSFETTHQNGTNYFVRYMKNGVLSPKAKSMNEDITSDKPIVSASAGKDFIRLDWQDMGAEKYNIYKYADGKAIKIGEVKKTAVKIINLSPDTEYKFIVTAVIDGKETTMLTSDILTVRTKKA